ncbi:MAG: ATP-binding protein [Alphaproteobacteria bacterium]|nr:ATP-binding protein [Alphaproteobacteria bacterium]
MIIPRPRAETAVRQSLARAPAVVLLGPRQIGKTTLARKIAESEKAALYLDLEKAADLRRLEDPGAFLRSQAGRLVIVDEVHRLPSLFAELRGIIDERREGGMRTGQFLLLGSASLDLVQHASETLAGRVVYLELAPITIDEARGAAVSADALWLRGGFPESLIALDDAESLEWRRNFIRSYLERDVPMFAPRMPSNTIGRLWTMLANAQGSLVNSARFAQGLGVSAPMINRYIDLLADLMLVRRLPPWSGNLNKRLVRSPKVYVRDSGVVHALLELETLDQLLGHPVVGPSWEGFVIETLIDAASPKRVPMFYRTQDGAEIDLLFERAGKIEMAFEVKRSTAPRIERGFFLACDDLQIERRFVVYSGQDSYPATHGATVMSLEEAVALLR